MATLKIFTNNQKNIWLTGVRKVEQLMLVPTDESRHVGYFSTEVIKDHFKYNRPDGSRHWNRITSLLEEYDLNDGVCALLHYEGHLTKALSLIYVVVDREDYVLPQLWVVVPGQNYLLENGKTVDRI